MIFFMNYRYGSEWSPDSNWSEGTGGEWAGNLGFNHYSDALNDLWNHLNNDPHNLKTMADLYGSSSPLKWAKLNKDELEEYKELVELTKEVTAILLTRNWITPFTVRRTLPMPIPLLSLSVLATRHQQKFMRKPS